MDKINFLITEVSLECLGNKYFDIYGNQSDSLLRLISVNSLKPSAIDADKESDLWKSLTVTEKKKTNKVRADNRRAAAAAAAAAAATAAAKAATINKRQPKRRASFSISNNEGDTVNDPESLLVPMAPKAAKIANRRSTISVQLAKTRNKTIPIATNFVPMHTKTRRQTSEAVKQNDKTIDEIKQDLRRNTDARKWSFYELRIYHIFLQPKKKNLIESCVFSI